jgi:hypothetical protein
LDGEVASFINNPTQNTWNTDSYCVNLQASSRLYELMGSDHVPVRGIAWIIHQLLHLSAVYPYNERQLPCLSRWSARK